MAEFDNEVEREDAEREIALALTNYWDAIRGYETEPTEIEHNQAKAILDAMLEMGWTPPSGFEPEVQSPIERNDNGSIKVNGANVSFNWVDNPSMVASPMSKEAEHKWGRILRSTGI